MTPEQRITQMEKLLETTIKLTHSNTQKIDANTSAIADLTDRVNRVSQQMGELTTIFIDSMGVIRQMQTEVREMQSDVREMQSEVKGLQIENRRIIERVFDEDDFN